MNTRKSLRMVLPAALLLAASVSAVHAESPDPSHAEAEVAGAQIAAAEAPTYEEQLREWSSAGYRVQPGHVPMFSLQRGDSMYPGINAEVAGVQLGAGAAPAPAPAAYEEHLRQFAAEGYRIQPGWVNTSAIARR